MNGDAIDTVWFLFAVFAAFAFVMFAGFAVLVVYLVRTGLKRKENLVARTDELARQAARLGYAFAARSPLAALPALERFEIFEGTPAALENLMSGVSEGKRIAVFDLAYSNTGTSGSGPATSRQTMCLIGVDGLGLPRFYLRPEGILEKALHIAGRRDIDFDTHPTFSGAFTLFGDDEPSIRRVFTPDLLTFFERNAVISVCGAGDALVVFRSRYVARTGELESYVRMAESLALMFRAAH